MRNHKNFNKYFDMGKLNEYRNIIVIALLILAGAFYWFQYRPSEIKKDCAEWSKRESYYHVGGGEFKLDDEEYDIKYKQCLREKGL